jgi:hypothetical protein
MNLLRLSLWNVVVLLLVTCWFLTALEFLVHWTVAFPRIVIGAIVAVLQELLWLVIGVEAVWNGYCRLFLFTPVNAKIFSVASFRCIITIKYRFYTFCVRILLSALLAFFKFFLSTSPEVRVACRVPDLDVTKVLRSVSAHTLQTMLRPDRIVEVLLTHIALCGPQGKCHTSPFYVYPHLYRRFIASSGCDYDESAMFVIYTRCFDGTTFFIVAPLFGSV